MQRAAMIPTRARPFLLHAARASSLRAAPARGFAQRNDLFAVDDASYAARVDSGAWLVDHTMHFPGILDSDAEVLFTRPPGFGKSLTMSALGAFLDVANAGARFDELFGHTWAGQAEQEELRDDHASRYCVLDLNFRSFADSSPGELGLDVRMALKARLAEFCGKYGLTMSYDDPIDAMNLVLEELRDSDREVRCGTCTRDPAFPVHAKSAPTHLQTVVLIDDYDSAAMMALTEASTEVHANRRNIAPIQEFYNNLKELLDSGAVQCVITTGTAHVAYKDKFAFGQGFRDTAILSQCRSIEELCGLREREVREGIALALIAHREGVDGDRADLFARAKHAAPSAEIDAHLATVRRWYGGYRFSELTIHDADGEPLYNTRSVLHYLDILSRVGHVDESERFDPRSTVSDSIAKLIPVLSNAGHTTVDFVLSGRAMASHRAFSSIDLRTSRDKFAADKDAIVLAHLLNMGAATIAGDQPAQTSESRTAFAIPNQVAAEEMVIALTGNISADALSGLRRDLQRVWSDGDPTDFIRAVVAAGFSDIVPHRVRPTDQVLQEQMALLARRIMPPNDWGRVSFGPRSSAQYAKLAQAEQRADVLFSDTGDSPRVYAVVEIKAADVNACKNGIKALTCDCCDLPDSHLHDAIMQLADDQLLALPHIRRLRDAAIDAVTAHHSDSGASRYVVIVVTPSRVILSRVDSAPEA